MLFLKSRPSVLLLMSLLSLGGLVACGPQAPSAAVTAVSIDQADGELVVGESLALSATVTAVGGAAEGVIWSSSDDGIATVTPGGLVEAVAVGDATITATSVFDTMVSAGIEITVVPPPGSLLWTHQFGTSDTDSASGVAVDPHGNVVVVGHTSGGLRGTSSGGADVFVRKVSSDGDVLWTQQFGTTETDRASGVAVDSEGNILIAGYTWGGLGGASAGGEDAFVMKLDGTDGLPMWTSQFGTANGDRANDVAVDSEDNVLIAGYTEGVLEADSSGGLDAFVMKLDGTDGLPKWTDQFGTERTDNAMGVAVDSEDNVLVAGYTQGDLEGSSEGGDDVFIRRVDSEGVVLWTHRVGSTALDRAVDVAVDSEGNILIAGYTGGELVGPSSGNVDMFVMKFDSDRAVIWSHQFGTAETERATGVAVDSVGNVIVSGSTTGDLEGISAGGRDVVIRKFDADGEVLWTQQLGTSVSDGANGIAVDSEDNILVAGETQGELGNRSVGGWDAFVSKLVP